MHPAHTLVQSYATENCVTHTSLKTLMAIRHDGISSKQTLAQVQGTFFFSNFDRAIEISGRGGGLMMKKLYISSLFDNRPKAHNCLCKGYVWIARVSKHKLLNVFP